MEPIRTIDPDIRPEYPDLARVAASVRRWWWVLVLSAVIFGLLGLRASRPAETPYTASAQVLVGPLAGELSVLRAAGQQAQTYADLATSGTVLATTLRRLGSTETPLKFGRRVEAKSNSDTRLLKITIHAGKPDQAAHEANTLAREVVRIARTQRPAVATPPPGTKVNPAEAAAAVNLRVVESATPPPASNPGSKKAFVAVAGLAGLLVAFLVVIVIDVVRRRIETPRELEAVSGAPALGILGAHDPVSPAVAALAQAREGLLVAGTGEGSAAPLALGIARTLARDGMRILLIDADPAAALSHQLGVGEHRGLLDAVSRSADGSAAELEPVVYGDDARILVLPRGTRWSGAGKEDAASAHPPAPAVDRDLARRLLAPLERQVDAVIACAGAATAVPAAADWVPDLPGAVVAVPRGEATPQEVTEAVAILERHGFAVRGCVLVARRGSGLLRRRPQAPPPARRRAGARKDEASRQPA